MQELEGKVHGFHRVEVRLARPGVRGLLESPTDSTQRATLRWEFSYCLTSSGSPTILGRVTGGLVGLTWVELERRGVARASRLWWALAVESFRLGVDPPEVTTI
jgi:hypothetical protein